MNLTEIGREHNTDKVWHGYTPHYERHFDDLRHYPVNLVEIGVASGASLKMWDEWFDHPDAFMLGIDIDPDCYRQISKRAVITIADGTSYIPQMTNQWDIVIDDGSHTSNDIVAAFGNWWPRLKSGGWYVIEDLAVQWRNDYGGGGNGSTATLMLKEFADQLWQHDESQITEFHVYNEIAFLRKS